MSSTPGLGPGGELMGREKEVEEGTGQTPTEYKSALVF